MNNVSIIRNEIIKSTKNTLKHIFLNKTDSIWIAHSMIQAVTIKTKEEGFLIL
jgi:hypothetical protein